jgi:hypothetical protein
MFYALVACNGQQKYESGYHSTLITNCCRNILQISLVNSHVLLDALFLEFGVEVEERSCAVRQNPLLQPQEPIRFKYKMAAKPSLQLIASLK